MIACLVSFTVESFQEVTGKITLELKIKFHSILFYIFENDVDI